MNHEAKEEKEKEKWQEKNRAPPIISTLESSNLEPFMHI